MIAVVNYANRPYKAAQKYCTESAYKYGADVVFEYGPQNIDRVFFEENRIVLEENRGGGYWLWKPYVICKALHQINDDDYLLYVDSGSYFISDMHTIIGCMEKNGDDIISFSLPFVEKQWTKMEILEYMACKNSSKVIDSCQRIATFIFMRKNSRTVAFMERYLFISQQKMLITDQLDTSIQDDSFIENRHDQSIFSVLAKIENIPVYRDPSEYGTQPELLSKSYNKANFQREEVSCSDYPQILVLHRKKKVNMYVRIMSYIRSNCSYKLYRKLLSIQNTIQKIIKGDSM